MEEILSGGTPVGAADHSPLATSLGDFEVLGSELDAEGTANYTTIFSPVLRLPRSACDTSLLDCAEEEVDIPRGERKAPLSPQEWHSFFDETGRITNERKLRKKIFYGVHPPPPPWALAMLCTPPWLIMLLAMSCCCRFNGLCFRVSIRRSVERCGSTCSGTIPSIPPRRTGLSSGRAKRMHNHSLL